MSIIRFTQDAKFTWLYFASKSWILELNTNVCKFLKFPLMHMCCLASNPWHYCQKWYYHVIFTSHALHCTALIAVKLLCIKVVRLFIAILHAVQTSALHVRWGLSSNKNISQTWVIWHNFTVFIIMRFLKIFEQCNALCLFFC